MSLFTSPRLQLLTQLAVSFHDQGIRFSDHQVGTPWTMAAGAIEMMPPALKELLERDETAFNQIRDSILEGKD